MFLLLIKVLRFNKILIICLFFSMEIVKRGVFLRLFWWLMFVLRLIKCWIYVLCFLIVEKCNVVRLLEEVCLIGVLCLISVDIVLIWFFCVVNINVDFLSGFRVLILRFVLMSDIIVFL